MGSLGYLPAVAVSTPSPPRWAASMRSDSGLLLRVIISTHGLRETDTESGVDEGNRCSYFTKLGTVSSCPSSPNLSLVADHGINLAGAEAGGS